MNCILVVLGFFFVVMEGLQPAELPNLYLTLPCGEHTM